MKQNIIGLIGICVLLFSACQKEDLPVTNEIRGDEMKEVTISFSFADLFQTGTEYEPMTKATCEHGNLTAQVNNTYHYFVLSYARALYADPDSRDGVNVVAYGTAVFDKSIEADKVITLTRESRFDPLTLALPAGYGAEFSSMGYVLYIYTGGNNRFEWAGDFKAWKTVLFKDAALLYKEREVNTHSSEYLSDSFSDETLLGCVTFNISKSMDMHPQHSYMDDLKVEFGRFNMKYRVLLKDSETAGGKRFSDYIGEDEDIFIYAELEAADETKNPVSSGLLFKKGLPYTGKAKETLRYCTSVSKSYPAKEEGKGSFYISTPGDELFAPFIPLGNASTYGGLSSGNSMIYYDPWRYKVKRVVCESVNSAGETVRFTYEGDDEIFAMKGNYSAFALELTDEIDESGNHKLAAIKDGYNDEYNNCYNNTGILSLFEPDFEEFFLD